MTPLFARLLAAWRARHAAPQPIPRPSPVAPPAPSPSPASPPAPDARALLPLHNAARSSRGLPPLAWDDRLAAAARGHAQVMASKNTEAHEGIGDGTMQTRVQAAGYAYGWLGENIDEGPVDAGDAMTVWLNSPPHLANIVNPNFTAMGGGAAVSAAGVVFWTCNFGSAAQA